MSVSNIILKSENLLRLLRSPLVTNFKQLHLSSPSKHMELKKVVSALQDLAPTSLAESWDNVGLLIEPSEEKIVKVCCLFYRLWYNYITIAGCVSDKRSDGTCSR